MDPVGADDGVRGDRRALALAAVEGKFGRLPVLLHFDAAVIESQQFRRQRALEQGQQVGPVRDVAMRAIEPVAFLAHGLHGQHPAVLPAAELPGSLEPHRERFKLCGEPEPLKGPHHVRRDHDPRADLMQRRGLLVDRYVHARLLEKQGGRESAQAPADDRDARTQGASPSIQNVVRRHNTTAGEAAPGLGVLISKFNFYSENCCRR